MINILTHTTVLKIDALWKNRYSPTLNKAMIHPLSRLAIKGVLWCKSDNNEKNLCDAKNIMTRN